MCSCVLSHFSHVWIFVTLWAVAHRATLSMGFSRQEYWSGLPSPPQGDLPDPGIKPVSPAFVGRFFSTWETPKKLMHPTHLELSTKDPCLRAWAHYLYRGNDLAFQGSNYFPRQLQIVFILWNSLYFPKIVETVSFIPNAFNSMSFLRYSFHQEMRFLFPPLESEHACDCAGGDTSS